MKGWKMGLLTAGGVVLAGAAVFAGIYATRLETMYSIRRITDYEDYNLYQMNVKYAYSIDDVIAYGIKGNETMIEAIVKESIPILPVHIEVPSFGCSAFRMQDEKSNVLMGRNYDFKNNTSALLVYCEPKDGYKSVAFAALDNISANEVDKSIKTRIAALTAPFVCLDGMNEKGVSIAVLTLDSDPVFQKTGKPTIFTSLAIRLVLDRAATTQEAVDLLKSYDMFAANGRDYHFYITDASGDSRVVEYDCESAERTLVDTKSRSVTNFYVMYQEHVLPDQHNGIYGHGRERYDKIEEILSEQEGSYTRQTAWDALVASSQEPKEGDVTSNTQWSIVYDDTNLTAEAVLRRDWKTAVFYKLGTNECVLEEEPDFLGE